MPIIQRLLFSETFDPKRHTGTLNSILEEVYNRIEGSAVKNAPKARVFRSTAQSIAPSTVTAVSFDTVRWNDDAMWSVANPTRLTAKTDGFYLVTGHIMWASVGSATRRFIGIRKGGATEWARQSALPSATVDDLGQSVCTVVPLAVNEYVEIIVFQATAAALSVVASLNFTPEFSATLISR